MAPKFGLACGQSRSKPRTRPARSAAYHAVAILPSRDSCEAARAARGDRVLVDQAPLLPLESCDRPAHCGCRYQHYDDRRARPRHQADGAPPSASAAANDVERRSSSGRRAEDRLELDGLESDEPEDLADTYFGFETES